MVAAGIELWSAALVQAPEHRRVLPLLVQKLSQTVRQPVRPRLAQQRLKDSVAESRFEEEDLFVEVERVELVVPPALLGRERTVRRRIVERRELLGKEGLP